MKILFLTCIILHLLIHHGILHLFLLHLHIISCLISLLSYILPHPNYQAHLLSHTSNQLALQLIHQINFLPVDSKDRNTLLLTLKITTTLSSLPQLTIQLLQSLPTSGILFPTTSLTIDFHTITSISHLMYLHNLNQYLKNKKHQSLE